MPSLNSRSRPTGDEGEGITEHQGRMEDAWALGGEEGRDKLRKAAASGKYTVTRRCPNGATRRKRFRHRFIPGRTQGTETS